MGGMKNGVRLQTRPGPLSGIHAAQSQREEKYLAWRLGVEGANEVDVESSRPNHNSPGVGATAREDDGQGRSAV
jgi:hypothetical protein